MGITDHQGKHCVLVLAYMCFLFNLRLCKYLQITLAIICTNHVYK